MFNIKTAPIRFINRRSFINFVSNGFQNNTFFIQLWTSRLIGRMRTGAQTSISMSKKWMNYQNYLKMPPPRDEEVCLLVLGGRNLNRKFGSNCLQVWLCKNKPNPLWFKMNWQWLDFSSSQAQRYLLFLCECKRQAVENQSLKCCRFP